MLDRVSNVYEMDETLGENVGVDPYPDVSP
jgi:hypothetical protein